MERVFINFRVSLLVEIAKILLMLLLHVPFLCLVVHFHFIFLSVAFSVNELLYFESDGFCLFLIESRLQLLCLLFEQSYNFLEVIRTKKTYKKL